MEGMMNSGSGEAGVFRARVLVAGSADDRDENLLARGLGRTVVEVPIISSLDESAFTQESPSSASDTLEDRFLTILKPKDYDKQ